MRYHGRGEPAEEARAVQEGNGVMNYEAILPIIESAIELARKNPKPGDDPLPDNYLAWVICQELRRNGWSISREISS